MRESFAPRIYSVIVVEDNVSDYLLMKEALNGSRFKANYNLVTDGTECLDFLRKRGKHSEATVPDLIILDLSLEKMDGIDVLREVKGDERLKIIPVVVFTGSNSPLEINKAYLAGANCYITKPIGFERLESTLRLIEEFWLGLVKLPGMES
jgi:two-component system response regulator